MSDLVRREGLPGKLGTHSYTLPADLTQDEWVSIGQTLQRMHESIQFWVGDWLLYGERRFDEDAQQAVRDAVDRGDESIRQTAWVASRFAPADRVQRLSWTHHRIAASLDEPLRYEVLALAAEPDPVWSTRRLQEHLDGLLATDGEVVDASSEPSEGDDWIEAPEDLTDDAREALFERMEDHHPADPRSFSQGFAAGLRWAVVRHAFEHWGA